jgi:hypothetical protein
MESLQSKVDGLQQEHTDASLSGHRASGTGEHHNDRPPRFQKMDFPKFDGKSDPLAFINRCESFHQQRIQRDEGTLPWHCFTELINLRFGPPLRSNPLGELMACKRTTSVLDF